MLFLSVTVTLLVAASVTAVSELKILGLRCSQTGTVVSYKAMGVPSSVTVDQYWSGKQASGVSLLCNWFSISSLGGTGDLYECILLGDSHGIFSVSISNGTKCHTSYDSVTFDDCLQPKYACPI